MRHVATFVLAAALLAGCSEDTRDAPAPPKPAAPSPPPAALEDFVLVRDVRVELRWDDAAQKTQRRVGGREYAADADIEKAIAAAHEAWAAKGLPGAPVTIAADNRVPRSDVIGVVNAAKCCGIEKIEFAMGAEKPK